MKLLYSYRIHLRRFTMNEKVRPTHGDAHLNWEPTLELQNE